MSSVDFKNRVIAFNRNDEAKASLYLVQVMMTNDFGFSGDRDWWAVYTEWVSELMVANLRFIYVSDKNHFEVQYRMIHPDADWEPCGTLSHDTQLGKKILRYGTLRCKLEDLNEEKRKIEDKISELECELEYSNVTWATMVMNNML